MSEQEPEGAGGSSPPGSTSFPYAPTNNGMAIASLVLGIAGFVGLPLIGPILALVFGYRARREIDASGGRQEGRGFADAGIVLGWVGIALAIVLILLGTFLLVVFSSQVEVMNVGEIEEMLQP